MRGEFVDVGGTRLYYYATGTRGGGDPVVLLHGFPGSSHAWRAVAPLLPDGRRTVVVDLMGCGRSDGPRGVRGGVTDHAALIRGLMDDLALPRAAIIGHGLGGAIALRIALDAPDRVSALGLVAVPAFEAWPARLGRLARAVRPLAPLLGAAVLASFVHGSAIPGYADADEGRRALDLALRAYPARLGTAAILAHLAALHDPDVAGMAGRLPGVAVPTAIVWGEDDPFLPSGLGARLRDAIPGATLDVIPGARHFVPEDAPDRCARALTGLLARA